MSRLNERIENFNKAFNIYSEAVEDFDEKKFLLTWLLYKLMKFVLN